MKCLRELNSKGVYLSSQKGEENRCLGSCPPESVNYEVSRRSRSVTAKKCTKKLIHVQICCFANRNLLIFCRRCGRCLIKLPICFHFNPMWVSLSGDSLSDAAVVNIFYFPAALAKPLFQS